MEILTSPTDRVVGFKLSAKLHDEDHKTFVPKVDGAIAADIDAAWRWLGEDGA